MKLKGNPFPGYENHYMSYMTGEEDELKAAKEAQAKRSVRATPFRKA